MPGGFPNEAKMAAGSKEFLKCFSFMFLRKSSFYYSKTAIVEDVGLQKTNEIYENCIQKRGRKKVC